MVDSEQAGNTKEQGSRASQGSGKWSAALMLYAKGFAMGLGDSVPGISGGTIAVITEIYDELIYAIRSLDLAALGMLMTGKFRQCWRHINGSFLLLVGLGMLSGLLLSANTVLYLLDNFREALMAFFVGLVLASIVLLKEQFSLQSAGAWLALLVGVIVTAGVAMMEGLQATLSAPFLFMCGAIAICAMILPGLSGAFILILLGAYQFMLQALLSFDLASILVFMAGCVCGLLAFSRLIAWLLSQFHALAYAFITGMLLGSLWALWPWQRILSSYLDAEGEAHALRTLPVWPLNYTEMTGQQPGIALAMLLLLLGAGLVLGLHGIFKRRQGSR